MRNVERILCLFVLLGACGTMTLASDDDIGPIFKSPSQTVFCMVYCDGGESNDGICEFTLQIHGPEGNVLKSQEFSNVPTNGIRKTVPAEGNRMLAYGGGQKMIACEAHELGGSQGNGYPSEPAWAILDVKGDVVAYMTNDAD